MSVTITPNLNIIHDKIPRYTPELDPYIFEFFDYVQTNLSTPFTVKNHNELIVHITNVIANLIRVHIGQEAIRNGKDPDFSKAHNMKPRIDELTMLFHVYFPTVRLSLTRDTSESDIAVYEYFGPRAGTYTFDPTRIESLLYDIQANSTLSAIKSYQNAILSTASYAVETHDPHIVAVGNGLYNKETKTLESFRPDYITTTKIATNYNPNAKKVIIHNQNDGTNWDVESWLADIAGGLSNAFDQDTYDLFWQIIAGSINPGQINAKAVFFYSSVGNNGKGTYGQLLKNLVGSDNYSSLPIPAFKHEFMKTKLIGKTINIADENPVDIYLDDVQDFKAMITGDDILINRKHKDPITAQIKAINIQMLNGLPKTRDKSDSFYRRLIIVPFLYSFTGKGERAYIKYDYIARKEVLEYVLKTALELPHFEEFITPERSKIALNQYKEDNNSAVEFWNEFKNQFAWDVLPPNFLYDLYLAWFNIEHGGERGSYFSKKTFLSHLQMYLVSDDEWEFKATHATSPSTFSTGTMMDNDEPLITDYNLTNFFDKQYLGKDLQLKRAFPRPARVRGIVRKQKQQTP